MLEAMGVSTGIDLEALLDVRRSLRQWIPAEVELYGFTADAGLPKGFRPAPGVRA